MVVILAMVLIVEFSLLLPTLFFLLPAGTMALLYHYSLHIILFVVVLLPLEPFVERSMFVSPVLLVLQTGPMALLYHYFILCLSW